MKASIVSVLIFAVSWCFSAADAGPNEGKADIRGVVKNFRKIDGKGDGKILAVILIEGTRDKDTSHDKASVKITKATKLVRVGAKDRRAATVDDLKAGVRVEAIFTGPVAESYPVQATAGEVRILEGEKK